MKTLLIDNGSTLTEKLALLSPGKEDIVSYENIPDNISEYSLILLSGSSLFPVGGNEVSLQKELELIRNTSVPIVGVCFGHELIAHAFGGTLLHLDEKSVGFTEVHIIKPHSMFSSRDSFTVYENHQYTVGDVGSELEVLARTDTGAAIIKHKELSIYGFQFHPEHHTDQQFGDEVFLRLFADVVAGR